MKVKIMKSGTKPYNHLHRFLRDNYGSADKCQSRECIGRSKIFDYALIKGKKYCYKRECFIMLCRRCHIKYDIKPETSKRRRFMMLGNSRGFQNGMIPWNKGKHPEYLQGKNHPMWNGGKPKCLCGKEINRKSKRCIKCHFLYRKQKANL